MKKSSQVRTRPSTRRVTSAFLACVVIPELLLVQTHSAAQTTAPPQQAQAADQDCEKIKQEIQQLEDELAKISAAMQALTSELDQLNKDIAEAQATLKEVTAGVNAGRFSEAFRGEVLDILAELMRERNQIEQQLEDDAKEIQAVKDKIADLLSKLGNCGLPGTTEPPKGQIAGPPQSGGAPSSPQTPAGEATTPLQPPGQQVAGQDCEKIKQEIQQLQDELAKISARMQALTDELDQLNKDIAEVQATLREVTAGVNAGRFSEAYRGEVLDILAELMRDRNQIEQQLEDDAKEIQAIKNKIADLLIKLANCGPPSNTQPPKEEAPKEQPTPPPKPASSSSQTSMNTTGAGIQPQLRGSGGPSIINANTPATAGFDGAVLFPLGNRAVAGPTPGCSGIGMTSTGQGQYGPSKLVPATVIPGATSPGFAVDVKTPSGLNTVIFTTPRGNGIEVYLPNQLFSGKAFSASMKIDVKNPDKNDPNGYEIRVGSQEAPLSNGVFSVLPEAAAQSATELVLVDKKGKQKAGVSLPLYPPLPALPQQFDLPTSGTSGDLIVVRGPIEGAIQPSDYVKVGGKNIQVLAKTSNELVALNTSDVPGLTEIESNINGAVAKRRFRNLTLKLWADKYHLLKGEGTTTHILVGGLEQLEAPASMTIKTTGAVNMDGGNSQALSITAERVKSDGTYSLDRHLSSYEAGGFGVTVTVRAVPNCGSPQ